ncbi:hypothetical protein B0T10DRAFT_455866 [Thelonectria olida]|uniref:SH3 domain-containing protein n=1 Tax=Thelonectria olida TaxID=1576542 RepID=A0A9P8WBP1_9HYPO|nr:hypothetical protein B0T10DRAFT_455866 [Thelonectria olida]
MDDVVELVVTPFQDIVEKGRTAVENAGDDQPMLKAARALVKEGERALKKIEPLCRKNLDDYGSNFLDALKENDEIASFRSELTDLLWEFDDYIELEDFEAEKFTELQALSRKAAPVIYGILVRMKLEVPADHDTRSIMTRMSAPRSPPMSPSPPPVPPLFPNSSTAATTPIGPSSNPPELFLNARSPANDPPTVEAATAQLKQLMQTQGGPDEGLYNDFPAPPPPPRRQRTPVEPPPRPPSANPWDVKTPPPIPESRMRDDFAFERRAPVAPIDSPVEPISPPISPDSQPRLIPTSRPRPLNVAPSDRSSQYSNESRLSPTGLEPVSYERTHNVFPSQSPRGRYSNTTSIMSSSIPEDTVSDRESQGGRFAQLASRLPASYDQRAPPSRPESLESNLSSVFDNSRRNDGSITPLTNNDHRGSTVSGLQNSPTLGTSLPTPIYVKPLPLPPVKHAARQAAKTPTPPPQMPAPIHEEQNGTERRMDRTPEIDYGPIPVDTETVEPAHAPNPFAVDCKIHPHSSFFLQKGFCEGAQDVLRGGVGVKKTKKAGFATTSTIGRCINCFFELDFKEIELDVNGADRGNFVKNGIGFRLRFLQKSHLPTRRTDDVLYACLFCVQAGRTLHASDATVFTSQKALFSHLARHPRPLPELPGVTIIDAETVPPQFRNNYDIHFKNPQEKHPVIEKANEIALLPTGTSREAARRMYGQRLLHDKTPALDMVQAAKIVGLHWPDKYVGEWAMGWHDGIYASLPMEILRLDQPPEEEMQMWGTSQIQVTTKWKFNPKDRKGTKWLKFDKEEVLSNIGWTYQDHWCWSGTNAKGTWGIFPQAFVDVATLRDSSNFMASDRASIMSEEKKTGGMLARFATRRSNRSGGRPVSSAGSIGSNEPPPTPSLY